MKTLQTFGGIDACWCLSRIPKFETFSGTNSSFLEQEWSLGLKMWLRPRCF